MTDNYIFQYYDAIRRIKRGEKVQGVRAAGEFIHAIFRILTNGIKSGEYLFDEKKADRAIRFIENFCHHSEGRADMAESRCFRNIRNHGSGSPRLPDVPGSPADRCT